MNKALKITLIVAGALLLVGVMTFGLATAFGARVGDLLNGKTWSFPWKINVATHSFSGYKTFHNAYDQDGSYSVDTGVAITDFDIKWIAGSATISVYDGAEVVFTETSSETLTQDTALRYGVENGVLFIQYCPIGAPNDLPMKTLDVKIPAALAQALNKLNFSATSADLTVSGLTVGELDCDSVSGRIDASGITARTVDADTTSGEVRFDGSYVRMKVNTVSGMVRVNSTGTAQETRADTTSGAMSFAGHVGAFTANTVSGEVFTNGAVATHSVRVDTLSGSVSLQLESCPDDLKIDTVSGGVSLTLPSDSGFTLEYNTVSGSINSEFGVKMSGHKYLSGDGSADFEIDTISGGLRINAA